MAKGTLGEAPKRGGFETSIKDVCCFKLDSSLPFVCFKPEHFASLLIQGHNNSAFKNTIFIFIEYCHMYYSLNPYNNSIL